MRAVSTLEARLLAVVEPVAADLGLEVVRVRILASERGGGAKRIQVMAERIADGAMDVENCADLSRALSAVFDVEDPFPGRWDLEVSSPGIDRPLTALAHFARWEGFDAKLELDRLVENRKRFRGVLAGVEDETVLVELDGEAETAVIPFAWIAEARLVLTDALIAATLKQAEEAAKSAPDAADEDPDPSDQEQAPVDEAAPAATAQQED